MLHVIPSILRAAVAETVPLTPDFSALRFLGVTDPPPKYQDAPSTPEDSMTDPARAPPGTL